LHQLTVDEQTFEIDKVYQRQNNFKMIASSLELQAMNIYSFVLHFIVDKAAVMEQITISLYHVS
jgi:hypothetical protein